MPCDLIVARLSRSALGSSRSFGFRKRSPNGAALRAHPAKQESNSAVVAIAGAPAITRHSRWRYSTACQTIRRSGQHESSVSGTPPVN